MSAVNNLLDKARAACLADSDSAFADRIGVTRQLVSQWRKGATPIPNERIAHIAKIAKEDAGYWLVAINAEQSVGEARTGWNSVARKLGAAAAVACIVVALPHHAHENSQFLTGISAFLMPLNIGPFIHYANFGFVAAALILLGFYWSNGRFRGLREVAPAVLA